MWFVPKRRKCQQNLGQHKGSCNQPGSMCSVGAGDRVAVIVPYSLVLLTAKNRRKNATSELAFSVSRLPTSLPFFQRWDRRGWVLVTT